MLFGRFAVTDVLDKGEEMQQAPFAVALGRDGQPCPSPATVLAEVTFFDTDGIDLGFQHSLVRFRGLGNILWYGDLLALQARDLFDRVANDFSEATIAP